MLGADSEIPIGPQDQLLMRADLDRVGRFPRTPFPCPPNPPAVYSSKFV